MAKFKVLKNLKEVSISGVMYPNKGFDAKSTETKILNAAKTDARGETESRLRALLEKSEELIAKAELLSKEAKELAEAAGELAKELEEVAEE
ncbi:hypothetical protein OAU50_08875 [Planctomycetota bacterium]|nr:hypothetical protein [Planctomycetota bacterium]